MVVRSLLGLRSCSAPPRQGLDCPHLGGLGFGDGDAGHALDFRVGVAVAQRMQQQIERMEAAQGSVPAAALRQSRAPPGRGCLLAFRG